MNQVDNLIQLNKDFYKQISQYFDQTRQYFWQGWYDLKPYLNKAEKKLQILDLGCGNARFYDFLKQETNIEFDYFGLDSDSDLIKKAKQKFHKENNFKILEKDIFTQKFNLAELKKDFKDGNIQGFDFIFCFGVIHHLPSELVDIFFQDIKNLLNEDGVFVFSVWDFINFNSVQKKIIKDPQKLQKIFLDYSLKLDLLDSNDYFLEWNKGINAIRYCRYFDDQKIQEISSKNSLNIFQKYQADGKEKLVNRYYLCNKLA